MKISRNTYSVYIVTNFNKTVLYTGVTNDIMQRISEHFQDRGKNTFAGKYHAHHLIYYEDFKNVNDAIAREKEIKKWSRKKKMDLIKSYNPKLEFLNKELFGEWPPKETFHRGTQ